jgi:hypothetical protein
MTVMEGVSVKDSGAGEDCPLISQKVNGLFSKDRVEGYECAAFLRELSHKRPCALYPFFNSLADLLGDDDPIIRLDISEALWQVARVDCQNKSRYLVRAVFPTLRQALVKAG